MDKENPRTESDEKMIEDFFSKLEFSELFENSFEEKVLQDKNIKIFLVNQ
mgnify:CR=1 FL=1